MGLPEKPSDEFDGALGQPLEAANDEGHFPPGFFSLGGAFCQDFFTPFFLCLIADTGFDRGGFLAHHEIVHEAQKRGQTVLAVTLPTRDFSRGICF